MTGRVSDCVPVLVYSLVSYLSRKNSRRSKKAFEDLVPDFAPICVIMRQKMSRSCFVGRF